MERLVIPDYQRPYRWSTESAITLVLDTYDAYMHNVPEYRMGSVILHKVKSEDGTAIYNIVDGQQRLTTLSILFYAFGEENFSTLLDAEYNELSCNAIVDNLEIIRRKINEIDPHNRSKFVAYLHEQCTLVKIVTYNEQEAFQFFDSQNSRGKELVPHDLLKSYHLREMGDESESRKIKIIWSTDWTAFMYT